MRREGHGAGGLGVSLSELQVKTNVRLLSLVLVSNSPLTMSLSGNREPISFFCIFRERNPGQGPISLQVKNLEVFEMSHPAVLRFKEMMPGQLGKMKMHATREGGDLDHCDTDRKEDSRWYREFGQKDFAKAVRKEIKADSKINLARELEALDRLHRQKDRKKRKEEGWKDPFRSSAKGPLREAILTASAEYFKADDDDPDPYIAHRRTLGGERETLLLSREKIAAFERRGLAFFRKYFPGQVRHLRLDLDEEVPHFHALIVVKVVEESKRRGKQILIQPSANPLIASYEHAQDVAGEFFGDVGLVRGERRAAARREAKERDLPLPERRDHVSPAEFRAERAERIRQREEDIQQREEDFINWRAKEEHELIGMRIESETIKAEAYETKREANAWLATAKGVARGDLAFNARNAEKPFSTVKGSDPEKTQPLLDAINLAPKAAVEAARGISAAIAPLRKRLKAQLAAIKGVANGNLTVGATEAGEDFQVADGADPQVAETLLRDVKLAPKSAMTVVMPLVKAMMRAKQKENTAIAKSAAVLGAVKGLFGFQTVQSGDGFVPIDETDPELVARLTVHMNRDSGAATEIGRMTVEAIDRKVEEKAKAAVESAAVAEDRATEAEERWNTAYSQLAGIIKSAGKYMSPSDHKAFCKEASFTTSKAALSVNPVMSGRGKSQKEDERE